MARKVLFFIAGRTPTALETEQMSQIIGDVQVRSNLNSAQYGDHLEAADAIAGTPPAAYTTAIADYADGNVTPNQDGITLKVFPTNPGGIAAAGGTVQMRAIKATVNALTGVVTMTDVTTSCAWTSATGAKGTVGAGTGLVTGANGGAGSTVVTATYDPDGGSGEAGIAATSTATFV